MNVYIYDDITCYPSIISLSKGEAGHRSLDNMLHRSIKSPLFLEESRFRSRFRMLFHSIRSSNTLLIGLGKPNGVLGFSANSAWLVSRLYIFLSLC